MGFEMILNLFVEHPVAAIVCLLIGGGIMFGVFAGFTGIVFFTKYLMPAKILYSVISILCHFKKLVFLYLKREKSKDIFLFK